VSLGRQRGFPDLTLAIPSLRSTLYSIPVSDNANTSSTNSGFNLHRIAYEKTGAFHFDENAVRYSEINRSNNLGTQKRSDGTVMASGSKSARGMGYHETTRVCSYVLSRPGSVRSVDRSRGSRLKGVRLRQDRARRRRRRRAGIPIEGVVDESGLRHTLAAVPESALFMQRITRGMNRSSEIMAMSVVIALLAY